MNVNLATIELIKSFEGFEPVAYIAPEGNWTIGYGTTAAAGVGIVPRKGMRISEAEAEAYLDMAVAKFAAQIEDMLKAHPTPNQFGAMVSLAYNIGPGAFKGSSVLRLFNAGDVQGAANAFRLWNKATVNGKKVVLNGLTRRREAERALFLSMNAAKPYVSKTPKSEHVAPVVSTPVTSKPVGDSRAPDSAVKPPLWQLPYGNKWADAIAGIIAAIASIFRRK